MLHVFEEKDRNILICVCFSLSLSASLSLSFLSLSLCLCLFGFLQLRQRNQSKSKLLFILFSVCLIFRKRPRQRYRFSCRSYNNYFGKMRISAIITSPKETGLSRRTSLEQEIFISLERPLHSVKWNCTRKRRNKIIIVLTLVINVITIVIMKQNYPYSLLPQNVLILCCYIF